MPTISHSEMHQDHLLWLGENKFWWENLRVWQLELEEMLNQAAEVTGLLEKHQQRLQMHAASIRAHEQAPRQHEHEIAQAEKHRKKPEWTPLAGHQGEALIRHEQRTAHQELNKAQYLIVSHWNALLQALQESASHAPKGMRQK